SARELHLNRLVLAQLPGHEAEGNPGRSPLNAPGADELLPFDEDILRKGLIGAAGACALGGDEKLADGEVLDCPLTGPRAFGKTPFPPQQRVKSTLRPDAVSRQNRRVRRLPAEPQAVENDPRLRQ